MDELCGSHFSTSTIRSWGFPWSQDEGCEEVRHRKGLGLGKLFWESETLKPKHLPRRMLSRNWGSIPRGIDFSPPQPCPAWGSGNLNASLSMNVMCWSLRL